EPTILPNFDGIITPARLQSRVDIAADADRPSVLRCTARGLPRAPGGHAPPSWPDSKSIAAAWPPDQLDLRPRTTIRRQSLRESPETSRAEAPLPGHHWPVPPAPRIPCFHGTPWRQP